ncbi:MAG: peptidyl-prolyl cis-trans isomerase, partial [Acidobacteriota bacterium]
PTDEAVRDYFEVHRADFARPRRWQLSQIFKRIPADAPPEERASIRRELEKIRERIVAGDAFGALAMELSDSPSRDLGGRAGVAAPGDLRPELAAVVGQLGAGELSDVVETADGYFLIRCERILDARPADFAKVEAAIRRGLRREGFERRWRALTDEWERRLRPTYDIDALDAAEPSRPAVVFGPDADRRRLSVEDYRALLDRRNRGRWPTRRERHGHWLRERLLLAARALAAEERGALEGEAWRWRRREILAHLASERALAERVEPVASADVDAAYARTKDRFMEPEAWRVRALHVPIAAADRRLLAALDAAVAALGRGELTFDGLRPRLAAGEDPDGAGRVESLDLGWLDAKGLTAAGFGVQKAVEALDVGESSGLVQEGDSLFVLQLVERRGARAIEEDDAKERLRRRLERRRWRAARVAFADETLAALEVRAWP